MAGVLVTLTVGSLCSGYGGLEMGLSMVVPTTLAWVSEVEPAPCSVLEARHPGVPNLGDITAVDWSAVERVDVVTAGFPCQDLSYAGKGAGLEGERSGLWFDVLACVRGLRPRWVVIENVSALVNRGLDVVTHGLAQSGYVGAWACVRASDVGACHRRERVFLVAYPADAERSGQQRTPYAGWRQERRTATSGIGQDAAADADGPGRSEHRRARTVETTQRASERSGVAWGAYAPAIARHAAVIGRPAPRPVDDGGRLSPHFVEWMMMLPEGWVTDIVPSRPAALKALGNGVVPLQAAHAIAGLLGRLSGAEERRGGQMVDVGPTLPTPTARLGDESSRGADPDRYKGPKSLNGRRSNLDDAVAAILDGRFEVTA